MIATIWSADGVRVVHGVFLRENDIINPKDSVFGREQWTD